MKFYNIITVATITILGLSGCSKSFLDVSDPTRVLTNQYYTDSSSLVYAANGMYSALQNVYGSTNYSTGGVPGIYLFGDLVSDDAWSNATGVDGFETLSYDATNINIRGEWIALYKCIGRCNDVILNAPKINITQTTQNTIIGQAQFLRALCYFNLVRIWGAVPLVTTTFTDINDAYVDGRRSVDSVYTQIISDLTSAEANLPVSYAATEAGRATKGAAIGLAGKVLLTQKKYQAAADKLNQIITSPSTFNVSLLSSYSSIFDPANKMNAEILFAVRYRSGISSNGITEGSPFNNWFMPQASDNILTNGTGNYYNLVHADLANTFETGDLRKALSIGTFTGAGQTVFYTRKFATTIGANVSYDGNNDYIVLRYADVLLMYAEALNELGQAVPNNTLNAVRQRAGLGALSGLNQANMRAAISHERRVELNMEGGRWFDLARKDSLVTTMTNYFQKYNISGTMTSNKLLFPIPATEIQLNPKLLPNNGNY